jgi:DNA-binding NarL/FixJ family response regulator
MGDGTAVLVVEREALLRRGLVGCLAVVPGVRVVAAVGTAEDAFREAGKSRPDVVLVGTTLPDAPGMSAAAEFHRRFPAAATVVVDGRESDDGLIAAIGAGAAAYVGQDAPEDRLVSLVWRAATGEHVIDEQLLSKPDVAGRVLARFRAAASETSPPRPIVPLTERELEILRRIGDGMTNAGIGRALGISVATVKGHVASIMRKLAVHDRTQAAVIALRHGWLPMDETAEGAGAGLRRRVP